MSQMGPNFRRWCGYQRDGYDSYGPLLSDWYLVEVPRGVRVRTTLLEIWCHASVGWRLNFRRPADGVWDRLPVKWSKTHHQFVFLHAKHAVLFKLIHL